MDEKRNGEYKFRVTKSESEVIEKRFEDAPVNSMSAFLRQQVVHGIYLEFDKDELLKEIGPKEYLDDFFLSLF